MEGRCGGRVLAATLARRVKMKKPLGRGDLAACPVPDHLSRRWSGLNRIAPPGSPGGWRWHLTLPGRLPDARTGQSLASLWMLQSL